MRRGMLLCGVIVCVFMVLALFLPTLWTLVLSCLLLLMLMLMLLLPSLRWSVSIFCVAVALLSLLRGVVYTCFQVNPVEELAGTADTITGQVLACPANGSMYTLRITEAQHLPAGKKILLYCNDQVAPSLHETVTATVEYRTLYDTQRYHVADGIFVQAYPVNFAENAITVSSGKAPSTWTIWLRPVRRYLSAQITEMLRGDEGALLVAMCFGEKDSLSTAVSDAFRACGLPHLLAVSGLHLSVVAGSLQAMLQRFRLHRKVTGIITMLTVFLYMWMVEFTPSVTRSGIMYSLVLMGLLVRRRSDSLNSLGLALTVILLATPNAIYDLGFWLSFGATAGIICFYPQLRRWLHIFIAFVPVTVQKPLGRIADSLSVTVAATLPLLPIMAFSFREVSLIAPLANLLSVLPAGWMLVLGFLSALLRSTHVFACVGNALLFVAGIIAKYLIAVSQWLGATVGTTILLQQWWQFVWLFAACVSLTVALHRFRARMVRAVWCGLLVILLLAHGTSTLLNGHATQMHILNVDNRPVIILHHKGESVVLSRQMRGLYSARRAMEKDGYRYPRLLITEEGESSHAAYLSEWMATYPATSVVTAGTTCNVSSYIPYLSEGYTLRFWGDHTLRVLEDGWWRLTMGETVLMIAPSHYTGSVQRHEADGYVICEDSVPTALSLPASTVFFVSAGEGNSAASSGGTLYTVTEKESCQMVTGGNGVWRRRLF